MTKPRPTNRGNVHNFNPIKEDLMINLSDLPAVLDREVDPRISAAVRLLEAAMTESIKYEDAFDGALALLIAARGWFSVSKVMEGA